MPVAPDGRVFDASSVSTESIRDTARYGGVRVELLATVVAEKLESLARLGLATSRMKDVYDLWHILRTFDLDTHDVRAAIVWTFQRRGTPLRWPPVALTEAFWSDRSKRMQWSAFLRRNELEAPGLEAVVRDIEARLDATMPW